MTLQELIVHIRILGVFGSTRETMEDVMVFRVLVTLICLSMIMLRLSRLRNLMGWIRLRLKNQKKLFRLTRANSEYRRSLRVRHIRDLTLWV